MKLKYKIINVDEKEHSIMVRYYTDVITEDFLANMFDEHGQIVRNEDGSPKVCRTDSHFNIWQTPSPTHEELEKLIINAAPVEWLKLQESIKNPEVDTSLSSIKFKVGVETEFEPIELIHSKEMTDEEIEELLNKLTGESFVKE